MPPGHARSHNPSPPQQILGRLSRRADHRAHGAKGILCELAHFVVRTVLDRMRDEQAAGIKTERLTLGTRCRAKNF